ncbi:T9SS type A sorting domain-containing protein [Flavobacterium cerinum]|uniref:T9SS type A sorting domain-containing protein n=1 Tax=Flavobacterium cerinum TaxID=2502784 RepID=A0A3S3U364_9FLAO|nr:T9SS type A sorting domain-containing protein [Flavobacterium cerinum]RWX00788.1 T9SS type A sorting domain-containing protein [Flavobacterium cerinum]
MKSQLQLFLYSFFVIGALIFANKGYSQISYSENFEGTVNWTTVGGSFTLDDTTPCGGAISAMTSIYSFSTSGEITSGSIGTSNGAQATLTFQYKLLEYDFFEPSIPTPNAGNWGVIKVLYATAVAGPYTEIGQITPATHVESASCAPKTVTFTPPAGSQVFIKVRVELGGTSNDFLMYFDDVSVTQPAVGCTGTPAASSAVAKRTTVCNGMAASLSLNPVYTATGYTYQWQKSTDGVAYTDIAGATAASITSPQTVNTWYRAIITCTGSGTPVTSTPVQVVNNGLACLCEVEFLGDTEPITKVQFAGINNTTSAVINGTPDNEDFTLLPPGEVTAGNTYPITLQGNTGGNWTNHFKVYIDFNHNGLLTDPGESFVIGTIVNSTGVDGIQAVGNITIPLNAMGGLTYMRVFKLYSIAPTDPCSAGAADMGFGQVEDYLLNITPSCTTAAPTAASAQSFCAGATVADLQVTGTAVKWFLDANVGSPIGAAIPLVNGTVYYATQTVGCESLTRTAVTVTINNVVVDNVADVVACSNYLLPALVNGNYYTAAAGGGTMLAAGDIISETTTLYVYKQVGTTTICSAEDVFVVTINSVSVDDVQNVVTCSDYVLPALENGAYYTAIAGGGTMLSAGDVISENATIYIYAVSETNPLCTAENSFTVTISEVTVQDLDDVTTCFEYVLPTLESGAYYTATAGGGTMLAAGDVITENATVYVYAVSGSNPACTAESSFAITINAPVAPSGNSTVEYISNEDVLLYDIEVTATGVVAWYETEEDAESGENPLPEDTIVPAGTTTYYATQTIGECESAPFAVTVDVVLGVKGFNSAAFNYYPNPVSDVLNLSYSNAITSVKVFNLLGQEVVTKNTDQNTVQIDLSQFAAGTYMVKIQSEDAYKVIKVVKR